MSLAKILPFGHENAIPRSDLIRLTGLNDRHMRTRLQNAPFVVANFADGKGYFQPDKLEELKRLERQQRHRLMANRRRLQLTRSSIKQYKGASPR